MCFSASASFITSSFLAIIGTLCLKQNKIKRATLLAATPLIFSLQQATEGVLWLSITHDWLFLQTLMPYIFLFFTLFVWPIWIPLAIVLIEPSQTRRQYLAILLMAGFIIACYLYNFLIWHGVIAQPSEWHIYYNISIPDSQLAADSIVYLLATVIPFFISSMPFMWALGAVLLASYGITYLFYLHHLVSLWCFFGALLSSLLYFIIYRMNQKK